MNRQLNRDRAERPLSRVHLELAAVAAGQGAARDEQLHPHGARLAGRHLEREGAASFAGIGVDVGNERVRPQSGAALDRRRDLDLEIADAVEPRRLERGPPRTFERARLDPQVGELRLPVAGLLRG